MTVDVRDRPARSVPAPTVGLLAQLVLLTALATGAGLGYPGWLVGGAYAVTLWVLLSRALARPAARHWGPADTVTLARATLAGGVAALVAESVRGPVPVALLVGLAAAALLLDAVDGWIARRTGISSRLGARFDMETDAFLVLVLSVFVAGWLGWWVLAVGLPRYAFAAATWLLPWLRGTPPERLSRKAVAVVQGVVLLLVSTGVVPGPVAVVLLAVTMAALVWSFGRDIGWLWRARTRQVATW